MNFEVFECESQPRTLYVGNLDPNITDELLITLFGKIGECKSCKIIHEPGNDPYAFIEFSEHSQAASALMAMNKRMCLERSMYKIFSQENCQNQEDVKKFAVGAEVSAGHTEGIPLTYYPLIRIIWHIEANRWWLM